MDRTRRAIAAFGAVLLVMGPLDGGPLVGVGYDGAMFRSHLGLFYLGYGGLLAAFGVDDPRRAVETGLLVLALILPVSVGVGLGQAGSGTTAVGVLSTRVVLGVAFLPLVAGLPLGLSHQHQPRAVVSPLIWAFLCWPAVVLGVAWVITPFYAIGYGWNPLFAFGSVLGAVPLLLAGLWQPLFRDILEEASTAA